MHAYMHKHIILYTLCFYFNNMQHHIPSSKWEITKREGHSSDTYGLYPEQEKCGCIRLAHNTEHSRCKEQWRNGDLLCLYHHTEKINHPNNIKSRGLTYTSTVGRTVISVPRRCLRCRHEHELCRIQSKKQTSNLGDWMSIARLNECEIDYEQL
jgi:hypothetical protein